MCVENRCIRYDRKATSPFSYFFSYVCVENRCIRYDRKATSPFSFLFFFFLFFLMCVLRTGVSGTTGRPLVLLVFFSSYVCVENRCIRYDRKATSPFSF